MKHMNQNRTIRRVSSRAAALLTTIAVGLTASGAWANIPPAPVLNRSQPIWLGFLIMFVLLAVVMAVSLMPSKRSHQD